MSDTITLGDELDEIICEDDYFYLLRQIPPPSLRGWSVRSKPT
jgi:hypothetical protein